jgi:hypothetical protein
MGAGKFLRKSQNKVERDERVKNKQVSDLRRENHQLKRKISKLQSRLAQVVDTVSGVEVDAEPEPLVIPEPIGCPQCGGNLTHVSLPFGTLIGCKCGFRKMEKK